MIPARYLWTGWNQATIRMVCYVYLIVQRSAQLPTRGVFPDGDGTGAGDSREYQGKCVVFQRTQQVAVLARMTVAAAPADDPECLRAFSSQATLG